MGGLIFISFCLLLAVLAMNYNGTDRVSSNSSSVVQGSFSSEKKDWNRMLYVLYLFVWMLFCFYWVYDSVHSSFDLFEGIVEKPAEGLSQIMSKFFAVLIVPGLAFGVQIIFLGLLILGFTLFSFIASLVLVGSKFQKDLVAIHKVHITMMFIYIISFILFVLFH